MADLVKINALAAAAATIAALSVSAVLQLVEWLGSDSLDGQATLAAFTCKGTDAAVYRVCKSATEAGEISGLLVVARLICSTFCFWHLPSWYVGTEASGGIKVPRVWVAASR